MVRLFFLKIKRTKNINPAGLKLLELYLFRLLEVNYNRTMQNGIRFIVRRNTS
jgi:hypothetical protein